MKIYYWRFCRCDRRRWRVFLIIFVTILNFTFGLFLISSVISIAEQRTIPFDSINLQTNELEQIQKPIKSSITLTRNSLKSDYEYYFRIDYKIVQGQCKPIHMFNTSKNLISIQNLTNYKLMTLVTRNLTLHFDIISFNSILKKTDKIKQSSMHKSSKTLCNYVLQLYIGLDFDSFCDNDCQLREIKKLTSQTQPLDDSLDKSFQLKFYSTNTFEPITIFNINQILIYQTSIYFDKSLYIRSYYQIRYVSSLIIDADASQTSITMSQIDRSLFEIKDSLDENIFEKDCLAIYISFLSLSSRNTYLRHENGRIKLAKNDQSILFKQDSTFKLLFSKTKKDLVAFQSINLPQFYIAVDQETRTALLLLQIEQPQVNIDLLDQKFLFKFIFD